LVAAAAAVVVAWTASASHVRGQSRDGQTVTFTRDVAPVLYAKCTTCHHPDGPAPFSLTTFAETRQRAALIATVTRRRYMPPWKPDPGVGEFVGERRLSDAEIALFDRWVAGGALEGDPSDRPAVPHFPAGWQNGEPDLVLQLPDYDLRPDGLDVFRNFVIPIPNGASPTVRYVRGLEFHPGSPAVHHANIRLDATPASRALDEADPGPGYEGLISHSADYPDGHFLGWTPGQFSPLAPKGLAWRLLPGSDFVVQLHMRPTGKTERIAPRLALYFTEDPPERLPVMLRLGRQNIDIAPGESAYRSKDTYTLPVDVQVQAVQPHSHYRGRQVSATAALPNGEVRPIIRITSWDFAWQDVYRVRTPYWLPAGTRVTTEYVMDNSAANPRNPVQPPARALWGFKSSDEMADVWIQVLTRTDADRERLAIDFRRKAAAEDLVGVEMQLRQSPDNGPLHNDIALLYLEVGRPREAAAHFSTVVEQTPGSASAHYNLATALERTGAFDDATSHYARAIALKPDYAAARVNLGNVRLRQGRDDEAAAEYEAALAVAPDDFSAHNNLGRVRLTQGRPADAAPHLDAAIRIDPRDAEGQFNMAELLVTTGRQSDAVRHYREAIALRPQWTPALVGLSFILSASPLDALRAPDEALQLANEAVTQTGRRDPIALDALGAALARTGRFDEAVSAATEALQLAQRARATALETAIGRRLALYRNHRAYTAVDP